jgi:hypothetical protein
MAFDRFWSASEPVPGVTADSYQPALVVLGDALHLVWSSRRVVYHAVRSPSGWSAPRTIAAGEQPALAATPGGELHCVFANPFLGNWEIYHVKWTGDGWLLPAPVSRTRGASTQPVLAADQRGALHAAWADTTPGESVIYYGECSGPFWSSTPVPSGRGCQPSIAVTASGDVWLAWQDRAVQAEAFDIYASVLHEKAWSLPDMVSDTPQTQSINPCLASNVQGGVHMVWLEEGGSVFEVRHSDRRVSGWTQPTPVSVGGQDCRQVRIVANPQGYLQVVWLEGNALHHRVRPPDLDATWWVPQTADGDYRELSDLGAANSPSGELHVAWSGFGAGGTRSLYWARRQPIFSPVTPVTRT